jgi:hypothetical protein
VTVSTATAAGTGQLDITNNSMVIRGMTLAQVQAAITQGFNGGTWNGAGINSSVAATDPNGVTAVGYADNGAYGASSFKGVTGLTASDVLVKFTYYGDADLSGDVTLDDFTQFLDGMNNGGTTWLVGDFDYSGTVTLDDFSQFLYGYQNQGAPLAALEQAIASADISSTDKAMMLAAVEAVPEPASALGLAALGFTLTRRRARSRRWQQSNQLD